MMKQLFGAEQNPAYTVIMRGTLVKGVPLSSLIDIILLFFLLYLGGS